MPRSGIVTVVGKPSVGKSTLLDRIVGQKLSITSPKPQSTRDRIVGIFTTSEAQMVLLDTPGLLDSKYPLQEAMRGTAVRASERMRESRPSPAPHRKTVQVRLNGFLFSRTATEDYRPGADGVAALGYGLLLVTFTVQPAANSCSADTPRPVVFFSLSAVRTTFRTRKHWGVGQLADRRTVNPEVAGSSPAAPATFSVRS